MGDLRCSRPEEDNLVCPFNLYSGDMAIISLNYMMKSEDWKIEFLTATLTI